MFRAEQRQGNSTIRTVNDYQLSRDLLTYQVKRFTVARNVR